MEQDVITFLLEISYQIDPVFAQLRTFRFKPRYRNRSQALPFTHQACIDTQPQQNGRHTVDLRLRQRQANGVSRLREECCFVHGFLFICNVRGYFLMTIQQFLDASGDQLVIGGSVPILVAGVLLLCARYRR